MNYLLYFFQIILIQYTSAQVITLGGRNFLNSQNCGSLPIATNFANNAGLLANIGQRQMTNIMPMNNLGQDYTTSSLITNSNYGNNIGLANLASGNIGLSGGNIGLTTANVGNIGSESVPYNLGGSNIGLSAGNIGNIGSESVAYNLGGSNIGLSTGNIGNIGSESVPYNLGGSNIGLSTGNIGNIGSESVAYKNVPMYANVVKAPREYGIEFSSGALSVGGNVEVNGRMPFNANVALNGLVPAQGQGAVDYKCDKLGAEEN